MRWASPVIATAGQSFSLVGYRLRSATYRAIAIGLIALFASDARAQSQTDKAISVAVDAFVIGGRGIGVNIPPEAAGFVKGFISCAAQGRQVGECAQTAVINAVLKDVPEEARNFTGCIARGTSVKECGTQELLSKVPEQARPLAKCIIDGGNVASCGKEVVIGEIVARAPEPAKPLVECIAKGGNPSGCAATFAIDQIPAGPARDMAQNMKSCVEQGASPEDCAGRFGVQQLDQATKQATQEAIEGLEALGANAMSPNARDLPPTVRNMITVVQGINEGDYAKIIEGGGTLVAKAAISIILNILLTPAFAPLIGPIVDAVVQNRVDLAIDILKAFQTGDAVKIGQIALEFYATTFIEVTCSLVPDGAFKDATCGNLGKVIHAVASAAADVAKDVLAIAKDALSAVGIYQVGDAVITGIVDLVNEIGSFLGIGGGDKKADPATCGPGATFYANNHLACLGAAAKSNSSGSLSAALNSACVSKFSACYKNAGDICKAMGDNFNAVVNKVNAALDQGAETYTSAMLGGYLSVRSEALCTYNWSQNIDNAIAEFAGECANALSKTVPLNTNHCSIGSGGASRRSAAHALACAAGRGSGPARAAMRAQCESFCNANPQKCEPPVQCWEWGRAWRAGMSLCWAEIDLRPPRVRYWEVIFPEPNILPPWRKWFEAVIDEPKVRFWDRSPGFATYGGSNMVFGDSVSADRFIVGHCGVVSRSVRLASASALRLELTPISLMRVSSFNSCSTASGSSRVALPSGGGAYLVKRNDRISGKKLDPRGSSPASSNTGGAYMVKSNQGSSALDRAAGATAGATAIRTISGNVGGPTLDRPRPRPLCPGCVPRPSAGTPAGGTTTKPSQPAQQPRTDPVIDYGGGGTKPKSDELYLR